MIEGLRVELSSEELRGYLEDRALHHRERRNFYLRQVENLSAGRVEEMAVTNDPISSLKQSARTHGERSDFFEFLSDHIVPGETYRLSEQDLTRIEIIGRHL